MEVHFKLGVGIFSATEGYFIVCSGVEVVEDHLMSSLFGAQPQISDVHGLGKPCLRWRIEHSIEGNMFEEFVHSEFVWVENHDCSVWNVASSNNGLLLST
mmetsp:Transcript_25637/g.53517  ORF Transcript_25637/g.53517 Transcript_25637/m.53517 type:complete len:100 (+) Transcript_25637:915-1214(+)